MEFAAPQAGEVVLQLARQPVGPFLAAGGPPISTGTTKTLRARLRIPAGATTDRKVRIGIAIEAPETSAFFDEARRLVIGMSNLVSTTYSSAEVAARSRLRLPEGFSATPSVKSPNEIDYQVGVPADALHGDWANLALEADGVPLGRARLQLFRPVSIRLAEALPLHFGAQTELTADPPTAPIEPRGGTNLEIQIRNNWPQIETYELEASGEGLEFFPPKTEISVGAIDERRVALRVFAKEGLTACATGACASPGPPTWRCPCAWWWYPAAAPWPGPPTWMAMARPSGFWNRRGRERFSRRRTEAAGWNSPPRTPAATSSPNWALSPRRGVWRSARSQTRWSSRAKAGGERCA